MMLDLPTRLVVAYGLVALMVLAAVTGVLWWRYNSPHRRHLRDRAREVELYLRGQQAAAAPDKRPERS